MNVRVISAMAVGLVLTGCDSGGGGGSGLPQADGSLHPSCSNDYYQQLIGTYRGRIDYASSEEDGSVVTECEWDTEVVIRPISSVSSCALVADVTAEVTQLVVLSANDRNAFQCFSDESLRRDLDDPNNDLGTPTEFANVVFPVRVGVGTDPQVPNFGSYFGDQSVTAFHVHLLDGTASVFRFWEIDDSGALTFVESSPTGTSRNRAVLQKVSP